MGRIAERVVAAASLFDTEPGPRPARGSRLVSALTLMLLALPLSAALRTLFGFSMNVSLAAATLIWAGFVALIAPLLGFRAGGWRPVGVLAAVAAMVSAVLLFAFRAAPFAGFPSFGSGDAGNHVWQKYRFTTTNPRTYEGMTVLYGIWHWLERLGADDLFVSRLSWQLALVACVVLALVSARTYLPAWPRTLRTWALTACAVLLAFWAAGAVTLPFFFYYQSDGFTAQVFALLPFVLAVLLYSLPSRRSLRLLALLGAIFFFRFTYLLNLGDLVLAAGLLFWSEARSSGLRPPVTLALRVIGALLALVGLGTCVVVQRVFPTKGGFFTTPLTPELVGLGATAVLFAAVVPFMNFFEVPVAPVEQRLTRLLAVLTGVPVLVVTSWLIRDGRIAYYPQKYAFCAIVLASLCVVPVAVGSANRLVRFGKTPLAGVAASALLVLAGGGLAGLAQSASTYVPIFVERFGEPPFHYLSVHAELPVWRRIEKTLAREHASFGGLLTPRWPESTFTNAHFGILDQGSLTPTLGKPEAGRCVFWYDDAKLPVALRDRWLDSARAQVRRLQASTKKACESFSSPVVSQKLALCNRCYHGQSRTLDVTTFGAGFYDVEGAGADTRFRWTNGDGRIPLVPTAAEAKSSCSVSIDMVKDAPFELWLDEDPLGPGPRAVLPSLPAGVARELRVRSKTFVPARDGTSSDQRELGVQVKAVHLECLDEPPRTGTIAVKLATYGRSCGAEAGNRTAAIAEACNGKQSCTIKVGSSLGDPAPNCAKDFLAEYRCSSRGPILRAGHPPRQGENYTVELGCD